MEDVLIEWNIKYAGFVIAILILLGIKSSSLVSLVKMKLFGAGVVILLLHCSLAILVNFLRNVFQGGTQHFVTPTTLFHYHGRFPVVWYPLS